MIEKLTQLVDHYHNIVERMSNSDVIADRNQYTALAKEHRQLTPTIELAKQYITLYNQIQEILLSNSWHLLQNYQLAHIDNEKF